MLEACPFGGRGMLKLLCRFQTFFVRGVSFRHQLMTLLTPFLIMKEHIISSTNVPMNTLVQVVK